jgi:uncharacterized protein YbjT (DUF2867 family)
MAGAGPRIVVTGGTGFVGRAVCERLVERNSGSRIVVPTRRLAQGRPLQMLPGLELAPCDVHDPRALAAVFDGADALVHLVAILHGSATDFNRMHVELPRKLAAACRAAGVRRVIHVSALGIAADAPSAYLRSKAGGEAVWHDSRLDVTVLRPSVIFGAEDRFTNLFARLLRVFPLLPLAGAEARFQAVWVGDVASAITACLDRPDLAGAVVECAGPDVLTLRQIVERIGRLSGHPRPVVALPEPIGRLQAALMGLLPGQPLMSADNLLSMRVPNIAGGMHPGLETLGIRPLGLDAMAAHFRS